MEPYTLDIIVIPAMKKRNRNTLQTNNRDIPWQVSQKKEHCLTKWSVEVTAEKFNSERRCSEVAVATRSKNNEIPCDCVDYSDINLNNEKYVGFHKDWRVAIKYVYQSIIGSPLEISWHRMKLIPVICHLLNINTRWMKITRHPMEV